MVPILCRIVDNFSTAWGFNASESSGNHEIMVGVEKMKRLCGWCDKKWRQFLRQRSFEKECSEFSWRGAAANCVWKDPWTATVVSKLSWLGTIRFIFNIATSCMTDMTAGKERDQWSFEVLILGRCITMSLSMLFNTCSFLALSFCWRWRINKSICNEFPPFDVRTCPSKWWTGCYM